MNSIFHRVWRSYTKRRPASTIGAGEVSEICDEYLAAVRRDSGEMDRAARALYALRRSRKPYDALPWRERQALHNAARAVVAALIDRPTVSLQANNRGSYDLVTASGARTPTVARHPEAAAMIALRMYPQAEVIW